MCSDFNYNFLRNVTLRNIERDIAISFLGILVKYSLFLSDFKETRIFSIDFREIITFYENPFIGSRIITCGPKYRRIWETEQTPFTVFKKRQKYDIPNCINILLL